MRCVEDEATSVSREEQWPVLGVSGQGAVRSYGMRRAYSARSQKHAERGVCRVVKIVNERNIDAAAWKATIISRRPKRSPRVTMSRQTTLGLYRSLLRAAGGFTNYNFREYAVRSVRDRFRANVALADSEAIDLALHEGRRQLEVVKRQSVVSQMFPQDKHAMESRSR